MGSNVLSFSVHIYLPDGFSGWLITRITWYVPMMNRVKQFGFSSASHGV